jgi:arylsulfatase A-like enzyme
MAEAFRQNGYSTFMAGKWHLAESAEYYPEQNGLILISEEIIRGIPPKDIFRLMVIHN